MDKNWRDNPLENTPPVRVDLKAMASHRGERRERAFVFVEAIPDKTLSKLDTEDREAIAALFLDYLCADCGQEVTGRRLLDCRPKSAA